MSSGRFAGKVALVTGAAAGFGRLAARRFAEEGAAVAVADVAEGALAETAEAVRQAGGQAAAFRCDVSSEADVRALVEGALAAFGRLDVAVNNAGVVHEQRRLPEIALAEFQRMLAVNAGGVFLGMKYQLPVMERQGGGAVVNLASAAGLVGAPTLSAYAASKHAVVGLTRSAADEYARRGIRVNAVCPSFAATAMVEGALTHAGGSAEESLLRLTSRVPMRRLARPEEVVETILWLASDAASFITGQAVAVDGGLTAV
jgi:NAD(P)-dependent dehydrogenase (short-subunit alcohol dehydrogenase family)